jgi:hypothetical protein
MSAVFARMSRAATGAAGSGAGFPVSVQNRLREVARSGNGPAVDKTLIAVKAELDQAEATVAHTATQAALAAIKKRLDTQSRQVADSVVEGVKKSFATAITRIYRYLIFIIAAGILATLFVPELPLRKTNGPQSAAPPGNTNEH